MIPAQRREGQRRKGMDASLGGFVPHILSSDRERFTDCEPAHPLSFTAVWLRSVNFTCSGHIRTPLVTIGHFRTSVLGSIRWFHQFLRSFETRTDARACATRMRAQCAPTLHGGAALFVHR